MEKKNILMVICSFVLLVFGCLTIYNKVPENKLEKQENKITDAAKFKKEYKEVSEDNVFVYRTADDIIKIMEKGTGIVYLGFPECPWCQSYVKYLDDVANEVGIDKIYYLNIYEDRKNNTEDYKKIVSLLGENLQYDDEGNLRIFVPNVSFHVNGKVIGNDNETSLDTGGFKDPKDYWNEEKVKSLKYKLSNYMSQVKSETGICTDCNK